MPHYYSHYKRNRYERYFGLNFANICIIFPILIDLVGPWMLFGSLVYSMVRFRYKNPCLVDFLSVLVYFGSIILNFSIFVAIYKAMAVEFCYLEPLFETWSLQLFNHLHSYFRVIAMLGLCFGIDFIFLKTKILSKKRRSNSQKRLTFDGSIDLKPIKSEFVSIQMKDIKDTAERRWLYGMDYELGYKQINIVTLLQSGVYTSSWSYEDRYSQHTLSVP